MKNFCRLFLIFLCLYGFSQALGFADGKYGQDVEKALDSLSEKPKPTAEATPENAAPAVAKAEQPAPPAKAENPPKPAEPALQPQRPNTIIDVEIHGNRIVGTNTILSKIQSRKGSPLVQETVNGDVKRLYATGFFEDIKMEVEERPGGYLFLITVTEKPVIHEIRLKGFGVFKEDKIRKTLKVMEGQVLDRQAVKQGVEAVRKMYSEKGYRFVDVQSEVSMDPVTKEAVISVTITEGEEYKIKAVNFEGAKAFKPQKLQKLMKTKKRNLWLFRKGVFNEGQFQKDLENVRLYYQQEGYLDAKTSSNFEYDKQNKKIMVTVVVEEGPHYVTGDIKIEGNRLFPESEIWQRLEMLPGLTYSQYYLSKDVEGIRQYYQEQGYMDARVIPDVRLNKDTTKVDVIYKIEEGQLYFVEKVIIRGNTKTRDIVIRRELRIRPGERFDGEKIKKSKQRLENLNYFEEVTYDTEPTSTNNRKDLVFRVKEKRTGELSFGGGISSVDTFMGFAEISQRNFDLLNWPRFTGGGQSVSLSARVGTITQNYAFNFTEPYLFNRPISLGYDIYDTRHDNRNVDFSEERLGTGATISKLFKDVLRVGTGYTLERVKLTDIPATAPQTVQNFSGVNWLSRVHAFTSHDTRDNVFNPTKGHFADLRGDLVGTFLGGDQSYYILQAGYTQYWTLFKKHMIEWQLRLGASQELGDSNEVAIFDRFYAGGLGTVRGYNYRRVGPQENGGAVGGQTLAITNLEYTFPIPYLEAFRGAFFIDAGHINRDSYNFDFGDIAVSVGPGIKVKTPIGPLAFYYGLPIANRPDKDKNGRFEFSLSRGF